MCRVFESFLKDSGPVDPNDAAMQRKLETCSTQAQVVICEAGGICKFLLQSLQFAAVDGYVCLASDSGKARQVARRRRQAQTRQPAKLNPPPSVPSSTAAFPTATTSSTLSDVGPPKKTSAFTYRQLAGIDLPSSSRVVPAFSQEDTSETHNPPAPFLSQSTTTRGIFPPNYTSSAVIQTTQSKNSDYNDRIDAVNGGSAYDSWTTVSKVAKSSDAWDFSINATGIGELDDFSEPYTLGAFNKPTLDKTENCDIAGAEQSKPLPYCGRFENVRDSLDELSDGGSFGMSSHNGSEADQEEWTGEESEMLVPSELLADISSQPESCYSTNPVSALDTFGNETSEASSVLPQNSASTVLSVSAPEFVPLLTVSQSGLGSGVDKASLSTAASCEQPATRASAVVTEQYVQTDESWNVELQQLKELHAVEVAGFQQHLQVIMNLLLCFIYFMSLHLCVFRGFYVSVYV